MASSGSAGSNDKVPRSGSTPLLLRSSSGRLCTWQARLSDTVGSLQQEIFRHYGLSSGSLRLWGRPLAPERTLRSYGIRAMSEVQVFSGGLCGGGACQSGLTPSDSELSEGGSDSEEADSEAHENELTDTTVTAVAVTARQGSSRTFFQESVSEVRWHAPRAHHGDDAGTTASSVSSTGATVAEAAHRGPDDLLAHLVQTDRQSAQLLEDWDELQQLEAFMRLLSARHGTPVQWTRHHIRGGPIPPGEGPPGVSPVQRSLAALLRLASPDLPLGALSPRPGGLYFAPPDLRFIPAPWRLRVTAYDVDTMGYEDLLQLAEELGSVPHRRATPEMLQRLPLFQYSGSEKEKCVICQEAYETGEEVRKLPCSHTYHRACIDRWLTTGTAISLQCPICKAPAVD